MNKTEAATKLEFLETSEDALAAGLRQIKRRHITKPGEMTLRDCQVIIEIKIDADVLNYFKDESGEDYKAEVNRILREKMEESLNKKALELKKLRRQLLEDADFLQELKEKLAA